MRFRITLISCFIHGIFFSQNLVLNPGFENCLEKPAILQEMSHHREINHSPVYGWSDPTYSADIYCMPESSRPNVNEVPQPDSGSCFCGLWIARNGCGCTEFVEGTLTKQLEAGKTYRFSVSIARRPGISDVHIPSLGVYFCDSLLKISDRNIELTYTPQLKLMADKKIESSTRWVTYYGSFQAKRSGATHFLFGAFRDPGLRCVPDVSDRTYFYFDNFNVTAALSPEPDPLHPTPAKRNPHPARGNNSPLRQGAFYDLFGRRPQQTVVDRSSETFIRNFFSENNFSSGVIELS